MKSKSLPSQAALKVFFKKDHIIHELEEHKKWFERFMFLLGLVSASMAIPQIISIYMQKDSSQVSLAAWGFYTFAAVMWIVYASIFKLQVTKRVNILFFVTNLAVVVTICVFR